jgi:excinuclease UvrABC ATPase subunit
VIATGTPEQVVTVERSHTGRYLRDVLAVGRTNAYGSTRN